MTVEPGYTITLERYEGNLWGHIAVHRWSHRVAVALRRDVDAVFAEHREPILASPTADRASGDAYNTWRKFMAFIGFGFHATKTDDDGTRHSIYVRWR